MMAEVAPTGKARPRVNFWRVQCVGFWNVHSLSNDDQLPNLSEIYESGWSLLIIALVCMPRNVFVDFGVTGKVNVWARLAVLRTECGRGTVGFQS